MEMCYDGALVMPSSYAVMNEEEMMYVEGGGIQSIVEQVIAGCIVTAIGAVAKKAVGYITKAKVLSALRACATAARVVWTAIKAGCAFVWNTPALLACLSVAVGVAVGVVCAYYKLR